MKGPRRVQAKHLLILASFLVVAGSALVLVASIRNDRAHALRASREETLFNATLSAARLDSILLASAMALDGFPSGRGIDEALHEVAFSIPQATNVYALDERGAVLAAAYGRNQAEIAFDPAILERLQEGASIEYRIVDAPGEGGERLVAIKKVGGNAGGARFVAASFSSRSIQGSLVLLTTNAYASARLIGADGKFMRLSDESAPASAEGIEVSLADAPLRVRFESDPVAVLAPWRKRAAAIVSMVAALALVIASLIAQAMLQWRRAREAEELQRELDRRDTLFREVNHRIKNNLAIVQTILDFGADRVREFPGSAPQTLDSAIDRVRAIASLHELLYRVSPGERDDFGLYVQALVGAVEEAYGYRERIAVSTRSDGGLTLSLDRMVPLALIVNELLTNAFKYAFPGGRSGSITVDASRGDDGSTALVVSDDGVGLADHRASSGGIGTFLVEALASQLGASVETSANHPSGLRCRVVVPPEGGGAS